MLGFYNKEESEVADRTIFKKFSDIQMLKDLSFHKDEFQENLLPARLCSSENSEDKVVFGLSDEKTRKFRRVKDLGFQHFHGHEDFDFDNSTVGPTLRMFQTMQLWFFFHIIFTGGVYKLITVHKKLISSQGLTL